MVSQLKFDACIVGILAYIANTLGVFLSIYAKTRVNVGECIVNVGCCG